MIKEKICKAFCDNLLITEVPIGLAIKTPFEREGGDHISFYVVWEDETKTTARLEDDGDTMPYLEACGVDFEIEQRKTTLNELLESHNAQFNDDEYLLYTDYYPIEALPEKALKFTSLLLRLQDFALMMSQRKTEETFKADLIAAIRERFESQAVIEQEVAYDDTMIDYVADVIIRPNQGLPLAIFIASQEIKALEAILFSREARERRKKDLNYMLVLETARSPKIKERTLARALNTPELQVASFVGQKKEVLDKMAISMGIASGEFH